MPDKKVVVLTGVLVAGAAAVLLMDKARAPKADPRIGQVLLEPAQAAAADRVDLKKGDKTLALVKTEGGVWRIGDAGGFPVDAAKLARLFDELGGSKLTMLVASKKEGLAELGLDGGTELSLTAQGQAVQTLALGDARRGGGTYVGVGGEYKAYLADPAVQAEPDAEAWELKVLVDVDKAKVRSVAFAGRTAVTLAREAEGEPLAVQGLADGETAKPDAANAESVLAGVTFSKRHDASNETARAALETAPARAVVTLFDGRTYEVGVGSVGSEGAGGQGKRWFLRIEPSDDAALKAMMSAGSFEVPAHVAMRFDKSREDFVESEAAKGTPKG